MSKHMAAKECHLVARIFEIATISLPTISDIIWYVGEKPVSQLVCVIFWTRPVWNFQQTNIKDEAVGNCFANSNLQNSLVMVWLKYNQSSQEFFFSHSQYSFVHKEFHTSVKLIKQFYGP